MKRPATEEEVATALARAKHRFPEHDYDSEIKRCLEEGLQHEVCGQCEVTFLACMHFVRCDREACPMKDPKGKTLLEAMLGDSSEPDEKATVKP